MWRTTRWMTLGLVTALGAQASQNAAISLADRVQAAQTTAQSVSACKLVQPFYWEVGDAHSVQASGQIGPDAPGPQTKLQIASASKWIYGAYVAQRRGGRLTDEDIRFLNFESGYTGFRMCRQGQTVQSCQNSRLNRQGEQDPATVGRFDYNGGHMQAHAVLMGLGALDRDGLAQAIRHELGAVGAAWDLSYSQPQLAGGAQSNAADYGRFLRAMLAGDLQMGRLLGSHPVCTNPQTCPAEAIKTPIPANETWHYSLGHWVEDDPSLGDGAFSSPGAFGFYPWIDAGRQYYGILAREAHRGVLLGDADSKPGVLSVACGRLIRQAWERGHAP
ncbi:MAG: hypothetical protein ACM3VZ_10870 [Acidobacteriota bacterium]